MLILGAVYLELELTPTKAIIYQIIAAGLSFFLGFLFLNRKLLASLRKVQPEFKTKEWTRETIPFSINSGVQIVRSKVLNYVLAIFGSLEAVAIFDVAVRGASLVAFTLNALNTAISPFVSAAFERRNFEQLQRILKKTGRLIFVFSLPVALVFIFGGTTLVMFIFGDEYDVSYVPLVILCIGQLVSSMVGSVGLLLNMSGNQRIMSRSNIQMMILHVVFSIPLVIYFDVLGAALIYSGLHILQNLVLLRYVRRNLKINTAII